MSLVLFVTIILYFVTNTPQFPKLIIFYFFDRIFEIVYIFVNSFLINLNYSLKP